MPHSQPVARFRRNRALKGRGPFTALWAALAATSLLGGCASAPRSGSSTEGLINGATGCHAPAPNLGRAYNRTYTVHGRTYTPLRSAAGYDQTGTASWYGWESGSTTSMGTRFNPRVFTAASRILPLPTCVEVTNLDNDRSALVLVNDRGPFVDSRILDLSYGAAEALGVTRSGTARVRITALPGGAAPLGEESLVASAPPASASNASPVGATLPADALPQTRFPESQASVTPSAEAAPVASGAMLGESPNPTTAVAGSVGASAPTEPAGPSMVVQTLPPLNSPPPAAPQQAPAAPPSSPTGAQVDPLLPLPAVAQAPAASMPADTTAPALAGPAQTYVQTGAFTDETNARSEQARLHAGGFSAVQIVPGVVRGQTYYRVQIGPLSGAEPDPQMRARLRGLGIAIYTVVQQ